MAGREPGGIFVLSGGWFMLSFSCFDTFHRASYLEKFKSMHSLIQAILNLAETDRATTPIGQPISKKP